MKNRATVFAIALMMVPALLFFAFGAFMAVMPDTVTTIHHAAVTTPAYDEVQHSQTAMWLSFSLIALVCASGLSTLTALVAWVDPEGWKER